MMSTAPAPVLISPPLPDCLPRPPQPARLGILASGQGSNMVAIADAIAQNRLHAEIQLVIYNNPGAKVADHAENLGIPAILLNHRQFDSREALEHKIVMAFRQHGVEWVIMAGWMRRVTQVLLDAFPQRVLNIHPSLLPSFPGVRAVEQALHAGVKVSGCTVHYAILAVDSGPIIAQAVVPVFPDDTPQTLQARIQVQEHRIYPAAIALATTSMANAKPA